MNEFDVILLDPPWKFRVWDRATGSGRSAESYYRTMALDELKELQIPAAKNAALFMWTVWPSIFDSATLMQAWRFKYKTLGFEWWKLNKRWERAYQASTQSGVDYRWLERLFFFAMGYYCLGPDVMVYVCHKETGTVEHLTLAELYRAGRENYLIQTPSGWREIKEMWEQPVRETVYIQHRFGKTLCTSNHRWLVKTLYKSSEGRPGDRHKLSFETVSQLSELREMATYKKNGLNLLFSVRPVESFSCVECINGFKLDYDSGWFIGLYCAEGSCQKNQIRFSLHIDERELADKVERIVSDWNMKQDRYFNYKVRVSHYESPEKNGRICTFPSKRVKELIKEFVFGERANEKSLNRRAFLQSSVEFRQGFIDGLLAGDGTKNKSKKYGNGYRGYVHFGSSSEQLIQDLHWLFKTMGVMTKINKPYSRSSSDHPDRFTMAYGLTFCYPRNSVLSYSGQSVLPVRFDCVEQAIPQATYDLSVDGEVFIADDLISHNTRANSEPCLLAIRGSMPVAVHNERNFIIAPVRSHSQKPDEQYEKIERLYPGRRYLELFARTHRPGWTSIGYELDGMDIRDSLARLARGQCPK